MSNFENNLKEHMATLDHNISMLEFERRNLDWGHDCDCEYCYRDELPPEETEKRATEIDKEIKEINEFKKKLMRHVELTIPTNKGVKDNE